MSEWVNCLERLPGLNRRSIDGKPYWEGLVFEPWSSTDGAIHLAYRDDKKFYFQERWTDLYCNIRREDYAEYWWRDCGIPPIEEIMDVRHDFPEQQIGETK